MMNILVATDYSESALTAEKYAVALAAQLQASLTFLHVYELAEATNAASATAETHAHIDLHDKKLEEIQLHCRQLIQSCGINPAALNYQCLVHSGKIGRVISSEAGDVDADLLVMGTHDANSLRESLFGGHTWEMIKKRNAPLLAIPAGTTFTKPQNIVFAAQGRKGEVPALNFTSLLAKQFDASITILHVTDYTHASRSEEDSFRQFERKVEKTVAYEKKFVRQMHATSVITGLNEFCSEYKAHWLVMSPEKTGFFEKWFMPDISSTRQMSFETQLPLLCVPDYYDKDSSRIWKILEPGAAELNEF
jgi:nucleotide-binding universal stress UspA family protein